MLAIVVCLSQRARIVVSEPVVATGCVVAADLIAAAMMLPKAYRDSDSETLVTFAFAGMGGALAAAAVGAPDVSLLLYPVYYCLVNGAIALVIWQRRLAQAAIAAPDGSSNASAVSVRMSSIASVAGER